MTSKKIIIIFITVIALGLILLGWGNDNLFNSQSIEGSVDIDGVSQTDILQKYGINISLPKGSVVTEFEDMAGQAIIIKNAELKVENNIFEMQIYMTNFEEEIDLTEERIKTDIPDMEIADFETIEFGGVEASAFIDKSQDLRNVWFVKAGLIYQITARPEFDNVTSKILESWKLGK